jgi:hypothetical protein
MLDSQTGARRALVCGGRIIEYAFHSRRQSVNVVWLNNECVLIVMD